jgi:hypothetical protein
MKYLFKFCHFLNIIISLIIIKISISSNEISSIIPVKKILITDDVKTLSISRISKYNLNSVGFGIKFDNTSNVSYVPYNLFRDIAYTFKFIEDSNPTIKKMNGIQELTVKTNYFYGFEIIHFILENIGITIPLKYYFIKKETRKDNDDEEQEYGMVFLTKEDQEYIIFGKNLIEPMNMEFKDENNFIIYNDEFISKLDE